MRVLVPDSSVVFKWFRPAGSEPHVEEALELLDAHLEGAVLLAVPDLLYYEIGNVLAARASDCPGGAGRFLEDLHRLRLPTFGPDARLTGLALTLAVECGLTFYDAAFLALGRLLECPVVTADAKILRRARPEGAARPLEQRPWRG